MPSHPHHPAVGSRRSLLGGAALAALAAGTVPLLGASAPGPAAGGDAPWSGGDVPLEFGSARQMARAARALLAGLDAAQRAKLVHPDLGDAARTMWSNFPTAVVPRPGIPLGDLDDAGRTLVHDLLSASTSSAGYHKMTGAIRADQVLHDVQGGDPLFGAALYYAAIFGSPEDARWAWMLSGHHMTAIFTIDGERSAFTPMFTGAQPATIASGVEAGWRALPRDASYAAFLLASLSPDQRRAAVTSDAAPGDLIAGPGRQASLSAFQGIPAARLDARQQRLLWLLVEEFVDNADPDAARAQLALVRAHWPETHFSWQGPPPDPASRYYFRVHAPRLLIEYDVQEPIASGGGHVHAITRDPLNDYGTDWLGLHYRETSGLPPGPGGGHGPGPGGPPGAGGPGGFRPPGAFRGPGGAASPSPASTPPA